MQHDAMISQRAVSLGSMPEDGSDSSPNVDTGPNGESAPTDFDVLDRIQRYLHGSNRFENVEYRSKNAPSSLVVEYDLGYFPTMIDRAYLQIRWFTNDDFSVHYSEQYENDERWKCRWDRHPNSHNVRDHFHPPPDAQTPGEDRSFPTDWRTLLTDVLNMLDGHIMGFWDS